MTKKLVSVALGLGLLAPVAVLAQTGGDKGQKHKSAKKKSGKKGKKGSGGTTQPPK